ncbi:MAG: hypothetical protein LC754_05095 [Acidobacteria bacterium]|nr:hypothetical protein [Acidobacteriota bacterium]
MPKKRLKPTLILALDPFAAAFCDEVRQRLERDFGARGSLIQTHTLVQDGNSLAFNADLSASADLSFDLHAAREKAARPTSQEAAQLFERSADELQPALTNMLRAGRSFSDIEEAEREGVEIIDERVIYLVLSSVDPLAVGVALEVARLIKWLYATRFADELHTLHALVLMPDLFENHSAPDYASTYTLLKKLDAAFVDYVEITAQQKQLPFESCWLIDGRNARAIETKTLAGNLSGYADAFAGFLGAEPERSGAILGRKARGRPPAYSSFGFGELYLPTDMAITRLSATLAHDITRLAFLGEFVRAPDNSRQLLLAAKLFVLSKDYGSALQGLERHKGEAIWRGFRPPGEMRESAPNEYVAELQRRHEEFERGAQLEYRNALLARNAQVRDEFDALLDAELDRLADASPVGLSDALAYLRTMVEPAIALHKHLLGEDPQNLTTALRSIEGDLDVRLNVIVDRQQTGALLEQIQDVRGQLEALHTDLRLLPVSAGEPQETILPSGAQQGNRAQEAPADGEGTAGNTATPSTASGHPRRQHLVKEIEETERQLQIISGNYRDAVELEDRAADALRREAMKRVLIEKRERVEQAETELVSVGEQLRAAKRVLDDVLDEKQQFIRRYFIIRPILFALVVFGVPLLAALGDIGPARILVAFFWEHLTQFLTTLLFIALVYTGVIFWNFGRDLNRRLREARERVKMLSSQLSASVEQLKRAHNDQFFFKYEVLAQQMRADTITHLIETANQRIRELTDQAAALREIRDSFARTRAEAEPASSVMRRPLLQAKDIDAYYRKAVANVESEAGVFTRADVRRSQVRRITPEEFRAKLMAFALKRFDHLAHLSIEEALLRQPDLVPSETANIRLRELNDAAEPLLRLRQTDATGTGMFAQRDTTLWVSGEERDHLHDLYRRICPDVNVRVGDNDRALRVLTRSLNFPAYFIGAIEFYRDSYERETHKDSANLPDVLPSNERMSRAHERFLLALAVGLVIRHPGGDYGFANGDGELFGTDRRQIAERLATNFGSQKLHAEFEARLNEHLSSETSVYQKLTEFLNSANDLDSSEREILSALTRKYF